MNTIDFQARTGNGSEVVQVIMSYDEDIDGIFDKNIESVKFEDKEVVGLLTGEQYLDLEKQGCEAINEKKIWQLENYEP
jgi:hypothetical protein